MSNKTKEVFTYVYNHPQTLEMLVKHLYNKSISEVLIRLLNVSDNVFEEGNEVNAEQIRQSFIYKVVEKLNPKFTFEDHLNSQGLLSELVDFK